MSSLFLEAKCSSAGSPCCPSPVFITHFIFLVSGTPWVALRQWRWPWGPCPFHPPDPGQSVSQSFQPFLGSSHSPAASWVLIREHSLYSAPRLRIFCTYSFLLSSATLPCLWGFSLLFSECLDYREGSSSTSQSHQLTGRNETALPTWHGILDKSGLQVGCLAPPLGSATCQLCVLWHLSLTMSRDVSLSCL